MTHTYVALDIETTGFSLDDDAIIEIGAIRFSGNTIEDTYSSLINPGYTIPYHIQELTGIGDDDVRNAPSIQQVLPVVRRFVGNAPVVGHSIQFDLGFMRREGILHHNIGIDTLELAGILLPFATRYSLTQLVEELNIPLPDEGDAHRALYDAQITRQLFITLLNRARQLDEAIISEIVRLSADSDWNLAHVFRHLSLEQRPELFTVESGLDLQPPPDIPRPLQPNEQLRWLDEERIISILEPRGLFDQHFAGFEYRFQQVDMLAQVVRAFNNTQHLVVEAGTGTGKSVAYLLPAIHWAVQNGARVVVSTNTIALQDQLISKDIPLLQDILPFEFRAAVLKGRNNYVCPRRIRLFQAKQPHNEVELRLLAKLFVWLPRTTTGDREELFMPDYAEQAVWRQVASDSNVCSNRTCTAENCFYARARRMAEAAHIIIINHALLLADVVVEGRIIPEYRHLIVDEAHHLEDNITHQLTFFSDFRTVENFLREISQSSTPPGREPHYSGLIYELLNRCSQLLPPDRLSELRQHVQQGHEQLQLVRRNLHRVFDGVGDFADQFEQRSSYNQRIRLTDKTRQQRLWGTVEVLWDNGRASLVEATNRLGKLHSILVDLIDYDIPDFEQLLSYLTMYITDLDNINEKLSLIINGTDTEAICWVERRVQANTVSLHLAPLYIGELFEEHILQQNDTIVLTSATLRTNNSFAYLRKQLNLNHVTEAAVGSPFDYRNSTLLYVPTDIPEPNRPDYQRAVEQGVIALARQIQGRTLVLFTAYSQLRATAAAASQALRSEGIVVYQQGAGGSRRQLLEMFKKTEKGVLMGTRSFWEGVDIPGDSLSCVILARIPFAVPSDPIISARSELYSNPFNEYSIPQAILAFRQGFGRLIRKEDDRGVVAVFDRRVISKGYGKHFIHSLPEVTYRQGPLRDLPSLAQQWIEKHALD